MFSTFSNRRSAGRIAAAVGAIAATAIVLTGCSSSSDDSASGDSDALTPVTFQTSWIPMVQFGGSYLADDKGYYEDNGVDVEILPGGPDVDGAALVASGTADIGVSNADTIARANANGADLVIIGAGYQKNPLAILSRTSNPIETPADMEGKIIGVPAGDTANHDALVEINDVDASKVTVVPAQFDVAPIVSGEADGLYVFYTEQPIALEEAGIPATTMLLADFGEAVYAQVYFTTRETLENKPDMVEDFMRGEILGWQDYVTDQTEAVDLSVNEFGKDTGLTVSQQTKQAALQLDLVVTDDTDAHGLFTMTDDGIAENLKTIKALGIDGADESLFDMSILDKIYDGKSSL